MAGWYRQPLFRLSARFRQAGKIDIVGRGTILLSDFGRKVAKDLARALDRGRPANGDLVLEILGDCDPGNAVIGGLPHGGDRTGNRNIMAKISAQIDARKYEVRLQGKSEKCNPHAVRRSARNGMEIGVIRTDTQW